MYFNFGFFFFSFFLTLCVFKFCGEASTLIMSSQGKKSFYGHFIQVWDDHHYFSTWRHCCFVVG